MVFSSIEFLFYFLPAFFIVYFSLLSWKNSVLLIASLVFYAWGESYYVFVLLACGLFTSLIAIPMDRQAGWKRTALLCVSVTANVLMLAFFKYTDFLIQSFNALSSWFGGLEIRAPHIHLPIGVSFFTFQAVSYLVDVWRRDIAAARNPFHVLLYIAMFPHQLAGPIVRFALVMDSIRHRIVTLPRISVGMYFFIIGLSEKVLIANTAARAADAAFAIPNGSLNMGIAWAGSIAYTMQIYFDFLGYSTMAYGLALAMGIFFPMNFNYPYIATSITDFWRRWHMTLSSWFRDYVYIPLGGNRHGDIKTYRNLLIVFFLCGLWHGASWTFVLWGLYHGTFLMLERTRFGARLSGSQPWVRHGYAMAVVVLGWVLFRAQDLPQVAAFWSAMIGLGHGDGITYHVWQILRPDVIFALVFGAVASTPFFARVIPGFAIWPENDAAVSEVVSRAGIISVFVLLILLVLSEASVIAGNYNPFIYFRF